MAISGANAPSELQDSGKNLQKSILADGTVYYKIYSAYEEYENEYLNTNFYILNPNVIPVLIISTPEIYFKGLIPYKGQLLSLRHILDKVDSTSSLPKINLFIIPTVEMHEGQFMGSGLLSIYVDYNTYYDIYGLQGKDLAEVINYKYYQRTKGEFFYLDGTETLTNRNYRIFFIPKNVDIIYDKTILNRVKYTYTIRFTSAVRGNC